MEERIRALNVGLPSRLATEWQADFSSFSGISRHASLAAIDDNAAGREAHSRKRGSHNHPRRAEQVLPAVAKIHAGEERQRKLIFPGPSTTATRSTRITAVASLPLCTPSPAAPEHPVFSFNACFAVAYLGDFAMQAVITAHKLGRKQRLR